MVKNLKNFNISMVDSGKTDGVIEEMGWEVTSRARNLQENVVSQLSKMDENGSKFAKFHF